MVTGPMGEMADPLIVRVVAAGPDGGRRVGIYVE